MGRTRLRDLYQNYRFHLLDVTVTQSGSILSAAADSALGAVGISRAPSSPFGPLSVLQPQIAFKSIDHPALDLDTDEIKEGTSVFPFHFVTGAKVPEITLERGVYLGDQDFHDWAKLAAYGRGVYRRDLLLVQFFSEPFVGGDRSLAKLAAASATMGALGALGASGGGTETLAQGIASGSGAILGGLGALGVDTRTAINLQAALAGRAWRLNGCIPTGYKSGSGLDAESNDITVAELTIQPEHFEEFSLSGPPSQGVDGVL